MKRYPDGTIEGSVEEIRAYEGSKVSVPKRVIKPKETAIQSELFAGIKKQSSLKNISKRGKSKKTARANLMYSFDEDKRIATAVKGGCSTNKIAASFGRSTNAILDRKVSLRKRGLI